ncbi:hypothetical protein CRUP_022399 [Coryphaenoides rupestris]|nr:hypothetical protein CRUP_022399 [Coryphaenoides rupestris]
MLLLLPRLRTAVGHRHTWKGTQNQGSAEQEARSKRAWNLAPKPGLFHDRLQPRAQESSSTLKVASYILIAVGALSMAMGFFGCIGAIYEIRCLLGLMVGW